MARHLGNRRPRRSSLAWSTPDEHGISDERRLKTMADEHVPVRVIARVLGRSQTAIVDYAYRHDIALLKDTQPPKRIKRYR